MVSYFYVMFRDIRMKLALKQLVARPDIKNMKHPKKTQLAFCNIRDPAFWKSTYAVCGVSYPNVRLLCLCDKSDPIMGEALDNSADLFLNVAFALRWQ